MTPADLARRLFRDQCGIGPNSTLEAYGETAAVAALVPLIEALDGLLEHYLRLVNSGDAGFWDPEKEAEVIAARAALTPQPEEVA